jgi:hypothetical protein
MAMPHASNHYNTLKVPQNASLETIRAAYKHLARLCHPDCNANSAESHRQMQSLNAAFDVIGDPTCRQHYDRSLAHSEDSDTKRLVLSETLRSWIRSRERNATHRVDQVAPVRKITPVRWLARAAFAVLVLWALNLDRKPSLHADTPNAVPADKAPNVTPLLSQPVFERPSHAPNGAPWPAGAAEVSGYPIAYNDGKSIVTLDNSRNPSDVFVKLVVWDDTMATSVRHIYIPGRQIFVCKNIRRGKYEVRYQDLGSGLMAKSGTFDVVETKTDRTESFSSMKITLARVTETKPEGLRLSANGF